MAISVFGVTHGSLRSHHFPHMTGSFTADSQPTATIVGEMIDAAAAELAGKLLAEGVTPSSITSASNPNAYAWCADTVRLGAAARVAKSMTGMNAEVAKAWRDEFDARCELLEENGYIVLGDVTVPDEEPNGPRSHIGSHGLDTGDPDDASSVEPRARRSDML